MNFSLFPPVILSFYCFLSLYQDSCLILITKLIYLLLLSDPIHENYDNLHAM